jgi:hypothetical protein
MTEWHQFLHVMTPAVFVPAGVFLGNWGLRHHFEYNQTAASDFLLAVLIFDGAVIAAAKDFEPFIRDPEFREVAIQIHMLLGFAGAGLWFFLTKFAEPSLASYYALERRHSREGIFWTTMLWSWALVIGLVAAHIAFFLKDPVS